MANLGKIVYLSAEQKDTLFANGSVTVDGTTIIYSANDLYLTPETPVTSVNSKTGAVTVRELPSVSSSDNGKFLCVNNGTWAAVTVPNANGVSF